MYVLTPLPTDLDDEMPTAVRRRTANPFLVPAHREDDAFARAAAERETLPAIAEGPWVAPIVGPLAPRRPAPAPSMLPVWFCGAVALLASLATVLATR